MTKPGSYERLWTPKKRAAFQAAWRAFGLARHGIYAALFPDLRPGLCDIGEAKRQAVVEAGKRWEDLTTLPPLCTAEAWNATCKAVGIASGTDIDIAESEITAWALARRANRKPATPVEAVYLGQGRVRIGSDTISLTGQERAVVEALVDVEALSKPRLESRSGCRDAVRILRNVRRKYPTLAPFIIMAGRANSGGYRTTIRRLAE